MSPHPARWFLVAMAGLAPVFAQTVRIVDRVNGPYFDPAVAVAASAPGDTILFRGGGAIVQLDVPIPLRIVAEAPTPMIGQLRVALTEPTTLPVVVTGVNVFWLLLEGAGRVVVEDVRGFRVRAIDTGALLVTNCVFSGGGQLPAVELLRSTATFVDCELVGSGGTCTSGGVLVPGQPGIHAFTSEVAVAGGTVTGGVAAVVYCGRAPAGAGIAGQDARVVLHGTAVRGGSQGAAPAVAVGGGTLWADSATTFVGATTPSPGRVTLAAMHGRGGTVGSACSLRVHAAPDSPVFVAIADRASLPSPTPFGAAWLDPFAYAVTVVSGVTDPAGALTFGFTMPALPLATPIWSQGLVLPPGLPATLTTPVAIASR